MRMRTRSTRAALAVLVVVGLLALPAGSVGLARSAGGTGLVPQAIQLPQISGLITAHHTASTACVLPDGTDVSFFHCYTPQQIRTAYGVDGVAPLAGSGAANFGQGQTIVLVDAYGSPTAASDLQHFHDTFFRGLPNPKFQQVFPQGNPQFNNTCTNSNGVSGPCAAALWSGEATLDIEWAYAIAPEASIVLLAVPPAETEGVQGFPNLFKAISGEIDATPPGTVFSMSFGVTEQSFGGAAATQTAKFDQVFQKGLAKNDNFFASSGDFGSQNVSKQHRDTVNFPFPTINWPTSSPFVVSVGGTQLQDIRGRHGRRVSYRPMETTASCPIRHGTQRSTAAWTSSSRRTRSSTAAIRPGVGPSSAEHPPLRRRRPRSLCLLMPPAQLPERGRSDSSTRSSTAASVPAITPTSSRSTTGVRRRPSPEARSASAQ